jgi:hypothetical protein
MAFQYEFKESRRPPKRKLWFLVVFVCYTFLLVSSYLLQLKDPWPLFTLMLVLLGLAFGACASIVQTSELNHHGIPFKGVILLSHEGIDFKNETSAGRFFPWASFSDISYDGSRAELIFFPQKSISFEISRNEVENVAELAREISNHFGLSTISGLRESASSD